MKYILEKKIALIYVLATIILATVLIVYRYSTQKVKTEANLIEHTQEVLQKSNGVLVDVLNNETGARGYILTKNEIFLEPYFGTIVSIPNSIAELATLTNDNPLQQIRIDTLSNRTKERLALTKQLIETSKIKNWNEQQKLEIMVAGKRVTDTIRSIINAINQEELSLLKQVKINNENSYNNSAMLFALLFVLIVTKFILVFGIINYQKVKNKELEAVTYSQKLASQYARSLIEASLDPLFTINTTGKITDMNNASLNITGKTRQELIGTDFFDYFTEPAKARQGYEEVFAEGFVANYPLTIRDHKLTDVLFNGSVYKDVQGNVLGVVVVARDTTEQKRIATELSEAIVVAEMATMVAEDAKNNAETATVAAINAVKSKQQFLSNMSHEIRTPMNAIIGFTKVVLKTNLNAKQKEYLTAIKISGDALIVLINDILDLAKVDAGKMTFEKIPFKMSVSLSAMLHLFETKIQEKNLVLIKDYDAKIPDVLLGDPVRLHQIILNLVSNAVKFTTKGSIKVSIKLLSEDERKVKIKFAVIDTGIGISDSKIENIFENFQQASSDTSRIYGGTGLGLAIVKQLVEQQGGNVTVKSQINVGSEFSFTISFEKTKADAEFEIENTDVDLEIKNIKILVVEDMPLNQLLMKTVLDDFGFERDIAGNGKIAIEKLEHKSYDIILMDLQMPEMNGFEATEYIRNTLNSKIPIMALTADVTTVDLAKCKAVGMNDYIAKPIDERLLYNKIIGLVKKPVTFKLAEATEVKDKKIKCIDLDYLNTRTRSNPELMMEMISLYLEQTPTLINTMKTSFAEKNWETLQASVHKIIPSFSIMGIPSDYENIAKKIHEFAVAQQETSEIQEMVLQLENICKQACAELEEEYNKIKKNKL